MNINSLWFLIFGMICLPALAGCSKSKSVSKDVQQIDSVVTDSIVDPHLADSLALVHKKEAIAALKDSKEIISYMENSDEWDKYKAGLLPSIAEEAPDYARKLLANEYSRFIIVDKQTMRVILYDKYGREEVAYGMACAKNYGTKHKKADSRTPEGFFSVEGIYDSTDWLFTDDNGVTSKVKGQFGPRFIRLKIPATSQIGIHGTCAPWSIGGRRSHGCIRITNDNILALVKKVEVGMPVIVSPSVRDIKVNNAEGYYIPAISTSSQRMGKVEDYGKIVLNDNNDAKSDTTKVVTDSISRKVEPIDHVKIPVDHNETPADHNDSKVNSAIVTNDTIR